MGLPLRPHTATYNAPDAKRQTVGAVADVQVGTKKAASGSTILGKLDQLTAAQAIQSWGLEVDNAGVFFCNVSDGATIKIGGVLTISGVSWIVRAKKERIHGTPIDHYEILVEKGANIG